MTKTAIPMSAKPHAAVYMRRKVEHAAAGIAASAHG